MRRKRLVDTEKDQYPKTRCWAETIHDKHKDIQGLHWISRQDDSARAVMLFGDRIPKGALQQVGDSRSLLADERGYAQLLDLADRIGVDLMPGKEVAQGMSRQPSPPPMGPLSDAERQQHRDELRAGRCAALAGAQGVERICIALEALGLRPLAKEGDLGTDQQAFDSRSLQPLQA